MSQRGHDRASRESAVSRDLVTRTYRRFLTGATTGDDGLTYKEYIHPAISTFWSTPATHPAPWDLTIADDRGPSDATGAHTLLFLARKVINAHISTLDHDSLSRVPWDPFGRLLWADALATRRATAPATFLRFAAAYPHDVPARTIVLPPHERLPPLLAALKQAPALSMSLCLDTAGTSDHELRRIPELGAGLRVLRVVGTMGEVDDGMVRSWCRGGRLSGLQVLELRGFAGLTGRVLDYVSWLPGVGVVILSGCHWSVGGLQKGWREEHGVGGGEEGVRLEVRMGGYRGDAVKKQVRRFVRVVGEEEEGKDGKKVKRQAPARIQKAVVRKKRLKDIGDLLAEFAPRAPKKHSRP